MALPPKNDETNIILANIAASLGEIAQAMSRPAGASQCKLGWDAGKADMVYIGGDGVAPWYRLAADNKQEEVPHTSITGIIQRVEKISVDRKVGKNEKEIDKLRIKLWIDSGAVIITTGFLTAFAKSVMMGLSGLDDSNVGRPVTLVVRRGETESVVFCTVLDQNQKFVPQRPYANEPDSFWDDLVAQLSEKFSPF